MTSLEITHLHTAEIWRLIQKTYPDSGLYNAYLNEKMSSERGEIPGKYKYIQKKSYGLLKECYKNGEMSFS